MMGRKLDLSGLTDNEAEHVLQVVQRDMRLRKQEEARLSELKQEQDEEGSRCLLLSRQSCFNQRCCIRCCSPFTFLFNPKQQCRDCLYNVCKACRVYSKRDKAWLCSSCQKSRLLKTQSLEWFYTNVKTRFKRFGSAEVLKTLYRKHLAEQGGCEYEGSIGNEGSVCGSDSTFYRQTEEHSMDETLTVALRVAEEAVDEAISKAEFDADSQEKQNEALYLREHRGELVEELAKTIVQKIISRRRKSVVDFDQNWPLEHNPDLQHHLQSMYDQACSSFKHQPGLWRSNSAFSLLDNDSPGLVQDLKKEGSSAGVSGWKSVDRLDNSVLKSPDGNWIALQSAQLSRPSLLTRRKSLVYSALEMESGVVSAYEGLGSDNETKPELDSSWLGALQELHQKAIDSNSNLQDEEEDGASLPPPDHQGSGDDFSDSEDTWKPTKPLLARLNRKLRTALSTRPSIMDVNFNVEAAGDGSSAAAEIKDGKVRKSQKKRKSKKASSPMQDYNKKDNMSQHTSDTLTSGDTTPEPSNPDSDIIGPAANQAKQEFMLNLQQLASRVSDSSTTDDGLYGGNPDDDDAQSEERRHGNKDGEDERLWRMETGLDDGRRKEEEEEEEEEEMRERLYRLVAQARLSRFSSTDDELDRGGLSEGEGDGERDEGMEQEDEKTEGFTSKLCRLEKEVRATQFSSTEDELDRVGVMDGERKTGEEEEKLAEKVYRLANQINAAQLSSTEDELDGRDEDGEEAMEQLWKLRTQKVVREAQARDLASLVGADPLPTTEDELDRFREDEGGTGEVWEGDLNVNMFYSREDIEDRKNERRKEEGGKATTLDCQIKLEDVKPVKTKIEVFKGTGERQLKPALGAERREDTTEEVTEFYVTRVGLENPPEAKWSDKKAGEERREEDGIGEGEQAQGRRETASDSEDEDEEFDRIISSMLMLTLEDMQVDAFTEKEEEKAGSKTDETGGNRTEETAGDVPAKQESGNAEDQREKGSDATRGETDEAEPTRRRKEVDEEKTEGDAKCDGDAAEGELESKDANEEETKEKRDKEQSCTASLQEGLLSPEEIHNRYSAVSLRSITTEVLKVLNATEDLLQGAEGRDGPRPSTTSLPPNMDPKKLDQQFSRLEENVYVAAGTVYSLEAELSDLEECARGVCSSTSDMELSFLEEQVASAAAKVQQSELQICDISSRIAALKSAGLNVDPQSSFQKTKTLSVMPITLDSSRQLRRRLPAPPAKDDKET